LYLAAEGFGLPGCLDPKNKNGVTYYPYDVSKV
jgi:hypothetical protein